MNGIILERVKDYLSKTNIECELLNNILHFLIGISGRQSNKMINMVIKLISKIYNHIKQ